MQIRDLTTLDECRQVAELEKDIWAYTDADDIVPPPVLIVSVKRGGILLGAFDPDGTMRGFVYSIPAVKEGRLTQWSHMLGVARAARGSGVGAALKLAQRDRALAMGIDLIEWTFDPLQAENAHLNFAKLGVVVEEYEENIYGQSSSPLHSGSPTDRFVAEWRLTAPHVVRRIEARGFPRMRDAGVTSAEIVNPSMAGRRWIRPSGANLSLDPPRLLVEIPVGFTEMQMEDAPLAREWRLSTRAIFQHYFARGYHVVDFFLSRPARRGQYLLAKKVLAKKGTAPFFAK
jgi:predicted GNAT superfamily acetyltransferase